MSATPRTNREGVAGEPASTLDFLESSAVLYKKGVECMAEIQNRTIDCAMQQNKEAAELWKQFAGKLPWTPPVNLFDVAGTLDRLAEAQKATIKLALDQTRVMVDMVQERTTATRKAADNIAKFAQQSFEQSVAAQKKVAEATIAETKSTFDNAREQFGEGLAHSVQQGFDAMIDAQKELLDTVSRGRNAPMAEPVATV